MNSGTLYTINDPFTVYYLSAHRYLSEDEEESRPTPREESRPMPRRAASTRRQSCKPQASPKLPMFDSFIQWAPTWVYCLLKGFGSLMGLVLAIVLFGFALCFIITHGPSLF